MSDPTRRRMLAGLGTAATAGLAGCSGLTGPITFDSASVSVAQQALSQTGYKHNRTTHPVITRTVSKFGITKTVKVTNTVAEYDRAIDLGALGLGRYRAAVFAILSTPQISFLGQTFNPIGKMSPKELAAMLQQRYENLQNLSKESEFTASVAGSETTVTRFAGKATLAGAGVAVDVYVYVGAAVSIGKDFVVPIAAHPQSLEEKQEVQRLLQGITHGE